MRWLFFFYLQNFIVNRCQFLHQAPTGPLGHGRATCTTSCDALEGLSRGIRAGSSKVFVMPLDKMALTYDSLQKYTSHIKGTQFLERYTNPLSAAAVIEYSRSVTFIIEYSARLRSGQRWFHCTTGCHQRPSHCLSSVPWCTGTKPSGSTCTWRTRKLKIGGFLCDKQKVYEG